MKNLTRFRASAASKVALIAIALPLFYYLGGAGRAPAGHLGHAPTLTSYPLMFAYPFAYAVASSLAAWEAGGMQRAGLWVQVPVRSRYRIAFDLLVPVLALAWLMLILPPALSLASAGVWPTRVSLQPLAVGMLVSAAHAVIGFAVGLRLPRVIAAPMLAVLVWILVAFTISVDPPWLRHLSGQPAEPLMFGEAYTLQALWPHVAFTGSLAAGVALLWLRRAAVAVVAAVTVALAGTTGAYLAVRNLGYNPPLATGVAKMTCDDTPSGTRVCVPSAAGNILASTTQTADEILAAYRDAGVPRTPSLITDSLPDGRFARPSTAQVWRVPLTESASQHADRLQLALSAIGFTCDRPDPLARREAIGWAVRITGTEQAWQATAGKKDRNNPVRVQAETELTSVFARTRPEQAAWFTDTVHRACGSDGR